MEPKTTSSNPRVQEIKFNAIQESQAQPSETRSRWSVDSVDHHTGIQRIARSLQPREKLKGKKSWRFYIAFFALAVVAFTSALDATSLSVALPVRRFFEVNDLKSPSADISNTGRR